MKVSGETYRTENNELANAGLLFSEEERVRWLLVYPLYVGCVNFVGLSAQNHPLFRAKADLDRTGYKTIEETLACFQTILYIVGQCQGFVGRSCQESRTAESRITTVQYRLYILLYILPLLLGQQYIYINLLYNKLHFVGRAPTTVESSFIKKNKK